MTEMMPPEALEQIAAERPAPVQGCGGCLGTVVGAALMIPIIIYAINSKSPEEFKANTADFLGTGVELGERAKEGTVDALNGGLDKLGELFDGALDLTDGDTTIPGGTGPEYIHRVLPPRGNTNLTDNLSSLYNQHGLEGLVPYAGEVTHGKRKGEVDIDARFFLTAAYLLGVDITKPGNIDVAASEKRKAISWKQAEKDTQEAFNALILSTTPGADKHKNYANRTGYHMISTASMVGSVYESSFMVVADLLGVEYKVTPSASPVNWSLGGTGTTPTSTTPTTPTATTPSPSPSTTPAPSSTSSGGRINIRGGK